MIEFLFILYLIIGITACWSLTNAHENADTDDVSANTRLFKSNTYEALAVVIAFGLLWPLTIIVYIIWKIRK